MNLDDGFSVLIPNRTKSFFDDLGFRPVPARFCFSFLF